MRRLRQFCQWAAVPAGYLALALWLCWPLVSHPNTRASVDASSDEALTSWFLAHTAHALAHLGDPFTTDRLGAPVGVNLAAQASMVGLGIPLAPITWIYGGAVALAVLVVVSPAATASAWYWLLAGKLRLHPAGAFLAALLVGFCPQEMAEDLGRNHVAFGALLPVIIWRALRLRTPQHTIRDATALGLLLAWQVLIGEEILLIFTMALVIYCGARVALDPSLLRLAGEYARRLAVAVAVAVPLLAYPLWRQFAGPGHIANFAGYDIYRATPAAYLALPAPWAHALPAADAWWASPPEFTLLGGPLTLLAVAATLTMRRNPAVAAAAIVAGCFAVLSLGVAGPWALLAHRRLFDAVLASRMILVVIAAVAVILAHTCDAVLGWYASHASMIFNSAVVILAAAVIATIGYQLAPARLAVTPVAAVPAFITSGAWRPYLAGGRALVTVPLTTLNWMDGQRMATATGTRLRLVGGYYLTTDRRTGRIAGTSPWTWTAGYFEHTIAAGRVAAHRGDRGRLLADLRGWRAGALVLLPSQRQAGALRVAVTLLLGPPDWIGGVWLWDVRTLTASA